MRELSVSFQADGDLILNGDVSSELPDIVEIINNLNEKMGREFEISVCDAINYLDVSASLTETTEAESDVIAEALNAEAPFFVVIECQAVRDGNQVGYEKIGQIRGNAASYLDTRRQKLFENAYKLVIGKPEFSTHAKGRSNPDVGLLSVEALSHLMKLHQTYQLSQDVLQEVFNRIGEIDVDAINSIVANHLKNENYFRKLKIYSLIYLALIEDPFSESEKRKKWTPANEVIGSVLTCCKLFRIRDVSALEIKSLILDLDNPFIRIIERKGIEIRLSTLSLDFIESFSPLGTQIVHTIKHYWEKLRATKIN